MCQTILEKMITVYNTTSEKIEEYKNELNNIKNIIEKHKNGHNNYLKKKMKIIISQIYNIKKFLIIY